MDDTADLQKIGVVNHVKDEVAAMHRHSYALSDVRTQRRGVGKVDEPAAMRPQVGDERDRPDRVVSGDEVANLLDVGSRLPTEAEVHQPDR